MKPYKFTRNYINQEVIELTVSPNVAKNRLYIDLLTGVTDEGVTMQYPLTRDELAQYKQEIPSVERLLGLYKLNGVGETKCHISNVLYFIIEFRMKYHQLLETKASEARVRQNVKFLTKVKDLSQLQKQNVKMSFVIRGEAFSFEDQPFLSEMVINKLTGFLRNQVKDLYPDLWANYKQGMPLKMRTNTDAVLRNQAVVEISSLLIHYLNCMF